MRTWWSALWPSIMVSMILFLSIWTVVSYNGRAVESHIDKSISGTVTQAQSAANQKQQAEIKSLTDALENQAVPALIQECKIIQSLHGTCPILNIQVK